MGPLRPMRGPNSGGPRPLWGSARRIAGSGLAHLGLGSATNPTLAHRTSRRCQDAQARGGTRRPCEIGSAPAQPPGWASSTRARSCRRWIGGKAPWRSWRHVSQAAAGGGEGRGSELLILQSSWKFPPANLSKSKVVQQMSPCCSAIPPGAETMRLNPNNFGPVWPIPRPILPFSANVQPHSTNLGRSRLTLGQHRSQHRPYTWPNRS